MAISRRFFLATGAAGLAAAGLPLRVWSQASLTLGKTRIDTLSDGNLSLPADVLFGAIKDADLGRILAAHGVAQTGAVTPDCNVTLLRDGTRTILFDAGAGTNFQPSAGDLPGALEALGVAPGDVTHVVFTHGHPDHLWGILDDFDDPVFTGAAHMMGRVDFDYWRNENTVATIDSSRTTFAVGAKRRLDLMAERFSFFEDGQEVLPGIAAIATPGHTPGHMSFEINTGRDSVMVLGDCIGNDHIAFERPDWHYGSDQDTAAAAATRAVLLDRLASENMRVIGFHIPYPGIGRAEKTGTGTYRFVADEA